MPKFTYEKVFDIMERANNLTQDRTLLEYMRHNVSVKRSEKHYYIGANIDSRTITQGQIFFPFKGANIDAYKFVIQAVCQADSFAVVDHLVQQLGVDKQIIVQSSHLALQLLAKELRNEITGKVIGITGSAGKTTCKNMLGQMLNGIKKKTYCSEKSLNTMLYGVPLSLINCPGDVFAGVFEAGMSEPGTLDMISNLMKPDIAIITSIQKAHIGNFDTEADIAYEKMQFINHARELVILPMCPYTQNMQKYAEEVGIKTLVFGEVAEQDGIKADAILLSLDWNGKHSVCRASIMGELVEFKIAHPAKVVALSAIANLLLCKYLELDVKMCSNTLSDFKAVEGRGQFKKITMMSKNMMIYDESYNANFDSMVEALKTFAKLTAPEKVLIIGQMNELGDLSHQLHEDLYDYVKDYKHIFLLGKGTIPLSYKLSNDSQQRELHYVDNLLDLFSLLHEKGVYYPSDTLFFVKGSRHGVNLDKVVDFLENYDYRKI